MCSARRPHSVSPLLFVDNQHKVIKNEDNTIPAIITTQLYRNYTYHIYTFNMCARGTKKVQFICAVALWNYSVYGTAWGLPNLPSIWQRTNRVVCAQSAKLCMQQPKAHIYVYTKGTQRGGKPKTHNITAKQSGAVCSSAWHVLGFFFTNLQIPKKTSPTNFGSEFRPYTWNAHQVQPNTK